MPDWLVAASACRRMSAFGSMPTIFSARPDQMRVDKPVPQPMSTTSRGFCTCASWVSTSTSTAGGDGRNRS
jgi:hypothetical protein